MGPDIARILIDRQTIAARVREMGRQLSTDLEADLRKEGLDPASHPDRVVMVPILTGGIVFVADTQPEAFARSSRKRITTSRSSCSSISGT